MNSYQAKLAARRERLEAAAEAARRRSNAAFAGVSRIADAIPLGQPILVGHHSEKRARADKRRIDNGMRRGVEESRKAAELQSRAAAVGSGGISSDDPEALRELRAKLAKMEAEREALKRVNGAWRKAGSPRGLTEENAATWEALAEATGVRLVTMHGLASMLARESWIKSPIEPYVLQNLGANIRRVSARIADLERRAKVAEVIAAESEDGEAIRDLHSGIAEGIAYTITADHEENRLRVRFASRTSRDLYARLRSLGLVWSPSAGAFQRKLSGVGDTWHQYAARVIEGGTT